MDASSHPTLHEYDLLVIGSGSGNTIIDEAWNGKRVAIVDAGAFGGTCLNVGCIPTKMYAYPAATTLHAEDLSRLGVEVQRTQTRWPQIRDRIFGRIDAISEGGLEYRQSLENVEVWQEFVTMVDPYTVRTASGEMLRGQQVVLAAGSRSVLPPIPGTDLPGVHTSDTIMRLEQFPQRVVVIGGGFIAAEFSTVFTGLGAQVTQINRSRRLLREHDQEIAERFAQAAAQQWDLRRETSPQSIERTEDGLEVVVQSTEGTQRIPADVVLLATGRRSNADRLGAAEAGLDVVDGILQKDEYQRVLAEGVPVPGVWTLGDVSSAVQLKHLANAQARTVQHNLTRPQDLQATDERYVPAAVFSVPQIAAVGLTEEQARQRAEEEGFEVAVKVQAMGDVAYGWAMEDEVGLVKLVARKDTGELLGAHLVGAESSLLVQPLVQAMSFGLGAREMARGQYWIHPALTEAVENALLGLELD